MKRLKRSISTCIIVALITIQNSIEGQLLFSSPANRQRQQNVNMNDRTYVPNLNQYSQALVTSWRPSQLTSSWPLGGQQSAAEHNEQRGALTRNLYSRGARNASTSPSGSWHFPRISPEHAAEMLMTGAQVINRIAQADTPLNYCKTPDNLEGECSDIRKCIWLVLDKARLKQSVCLRNLIIPAVCCPISNANNTPMANMIQSTLEPVLFRPKGSKNQQQPTQKVSSVVSIVSSTPSTSTTTTTTTPFSSSSSIATFTIRDDGSTMAVPVSTSTTPATIVPHDTHTGSQKPHAPNSLFQDHEPTGLDHDHLYAQVTKNTLYNRTLSQRYSWANETCGDSGRARTGRIVGGSDSKLGQWPWMTAMYLNKRSAFTSGAGEFWCGGALINRRFILTAAHCLSDQRGNRYKNDQVTIKLGGVDLVRHQAPLDILRNAELGEQRATIGHVENGADQTFTLHRRRKRSAGRGPKTNRSSIRQTSQRSGDNEEEFSWTSFITKALGLTGSSSSSPTSSPSSAASLTSSQISSDVSTKAVDSQTRKQQLAAHAKKIYFKEYKVANIKQHPKFQRHGFYNDIGLIELKSEVDYDELVSPICLPTEYDLKRDLTGYMATVLGWGTLSYGGQGSRLLQQVAMPVWSNKDCDDRYLQHIGKTFLCAGFLTGGKDACQGDSGGPLMVSDQTGRWTLHGVVSFGKTCAQAGYPGVYTRVTEYLDWIQDNAVAAG